MTPIQAGPVSGNKILWHHDVLRSLGRREWPRPVGFEIDLTNYCNLRCGHCTNAAFRAQVLDELEPEVAEQCIQDMVELGVRSVTFTGGGEPLMHPYVDELFELASASLDAAFITNGALLATNGHSARIAKLLMKAVWIRVSLDAGTREEYIKRHCLDAFKDASTGIRLLVNARKAYCGDCKEPTIGVGYLTDGDTTTDDALRAVRYVKTLEPDYIQLRPIAYAPWDSRFSQFSWAKAPIDFERLAQENTSNFRVIGSTPKYDVADKPFARDYDRCTGVYVAAVVAANGEVYPCCHLRGLNQYSLGNVRERRLKDIWYDYSKREVIYNSIDFESDCQPMCRFNATNTICARLHGSTDEAERLASMANDLPAPEHVNFL